MRKFLAIPVLAVALVLGFGLPALAGNPTGPPPPLPADELVLNGTCLPVAQVLRWAAPGTVAECGECGKTWVAYKQEYANMVDFTTHWRPEKRLERWRRERRRRRQS